MAGNTPFSLSLKQVSLMSARLVMLPPWVPFKVLLHCSMLLETSCWLSWIWDNLLRACRTHTHNFTLCSRLVFLNDLMSWSLDIALADAHNATVGSSIVHTMSHISSLLFFSVVTSWHRSGGLVNWSKWSNEKFWHSLTNGSQIPQLTLEWRSEQHRAAQEPSPAFTGGPEFAVWSPQESRFADLNKHTLSEEKDCLIQFYTSANTVNTTLIYWVLNNVPSSCKPTFLTDIFLSLLQLINSCHNVPSSSLICAVLPPFTECYLPP